MILTERSTATVSRLCHPMQDWERGVSEVPDYVLNLIAYKVKNEKEKGNI